VSPKGEGLNPSIQTITKILKFDIDGDKQDEVLISASSEGVKDGGALGSIMYMRKIVKGKVQSIMLADYLISSSDEAAVQNAGYITPLDVCDLNGDGIMEIVTRATGIDFLEYAVYQFKDNGFTSVLSNGAGA